jgi:hypothetical protein
MIELTHHLPKNARVALKGEAAGLYEYGCAGNEGWIRGQKKDKWGYPMVKIEWDKDHWAYNGIEDMWTFESHFVPVKKEEPVTEQNEQAAFQAFMAKAFEAYKASQGEEPEPDEPQQQVVVEREEELNQDQQKYAEVLKQAFEVAAEADGFLMLMISREEHPQTQREMLVPAAFEYYLSPEARVLTEGQLSQVAAQAHMALSLDRVREIMGRDDS